MTSRVDVFNLALTEFVGQSRTVLSEDEKSEEARLCLLHIEQARGELLEKYGWHFATTTMALAEVANTSGRWRYAYSRPIINVRKIRRVLDQEDCGYSDPRVFPHDVRGGVIYCDISPAYLEYVKDFTDYSLMPSLFVRALAAHLSTKIAFPISKDRGVQDGCLKLAAMAIGDALEADANESHNMHDFEPSHLLARLA